MINELKGAKVTWEDLIEITDAEEDFCELPMRMFEEKVFSPYDPDWKLIERVHAELSQCRREGNLIIYKLVELVEKLKGEVK